MLLLFGPQSHSCKTQNKLSAIIMAVKVRTTRHSLPVSVARTSTTSIVHEDCYLVDSAQLRLLISIDLR